MKATSAAKLSNFARVAMPWEIGAHIRVGLHRLNSLKVAALRVDHPYAPYREVAAAVPEGRRDGAFHPNDQPQIPTRIFDRAAGCDKNGEWLLSNVWIVVLPPMAPSTVAIM